VKLGAPGWGPPPETAEAAEVETADAKEEEAAK